MDVIAAAREKQDAFLRALCELVEGQTSRDTTLESLRGKLGISQHDAISLEMQLREDGRVAPGRGGARIKLTSSGLSYLENAGGPATGPNSITIYNAYAPIQQGTVDSSQIVGPISAGARDEDRPVGARLLAENARMELAPGGGTVFSIRMCNFGPDPASDVIVWLVPQLGDIEAPDAPHATPQHRVAQVEPDGKWIYFALTQSGPTLGKALVDAFVTASWLDASGKRQRAAIGELHIYG